MIKNKEELIETIEDHIKDVESGKGNEGNKSVRIHLAFLEFNKRFLNEIKKVHLPKIIEEDWGFDFLITEEDARLMLVLFDNTLKPIQIFPLITMQPKMFTVNEYANLCNTNDGTIRQWIRRGNIQAVKCGDEWRISEFTEFRKNKRKNKM